jgi:hypothetical protein
MPKFAPTTIIVATTPTTVNINPRIPLTSLPVNSITKNTRRQRTQNGHSNKGVLLDPGTITPPFINLYEIHLVGLYNPTFISY